MLSSKNVLVNLENHLYHTLVGEVPMAMPKYTFVCLSRSTIQVE